MQPRIPIILAAAIVLTACSRADTGHTHSKATADAKPAFDPGTMTSPPSLAEVTGSDTVSRAKAEEVYFRCSKVPRTERKSDQWCQLRDEIF